MFLESVKSFSDGGYEIQLFETIEILDDFEGGFQSVDICVWETGVERGKGVFNARLSCSLLYTLLYTLL